MFKHKNNYIELLQEFKDYREQAEDKIENLTNELNDYLNDEYMIKKNKAKDVDNLEYRIERLERENAKYEADIKHLEKELNFRTDMINKILDNLYISKEVINDVTTSK